MLTPFHIVIKYPLHITNRRKKKISHKYCPVVLYFFSLHDLYGSHTYIKATNITKTEATNLDILIMTISAALHYMVINCNWSTLPVME